MLFHGDHQSQACSDDDLDAFFMRGDNKMKCACNNVTAVVNRRDNTASYAKLNGRRERVSHFALL